MCADASVRSCVCIDEREHACMRARAGSARARVRAVRAAHECRNPHAPSSASRARAPGKRRDEPRTKTAESKAYDSVQNRIITRQDRHETGSAPTRIGLSWIVGASVRARGRTDIACVCARARPRARSPGHVDAAAGRDVAGVLLLQREHLRARRNVVRVCVCVRACVCVRD